MAIYPTQTSYFKRKCIDTGMKLGLLSSFMGSAGEGLLVCYLHTSTSHQVHFQYVHPLLNFHSCPLREPLSVLVLPSTTLDFPKLYVCFSRMSSP